MTNLSSKPTLKQFMELAFDPDEYCLVAHDKPFLNRKSILMGQAETLAGFKSDGGSWIGINPCDDTGTYEKGNVTAIRNIVFEADNMPLGEQETIIKSLKIPYSAAVYSGGKSFHIWICLDIPIDNETFVTYTKRLQQYLLDNGYAIDKSICNANRLMRLPTAVRGEKEQVLLSLKHRLKESEFFFNFIDRFCPEYVPKAARSDGTIQKSDTIRNVHDAVDHCDKKWPLEAGQKQNSLFSWAIYLVANTDLTREQMIDLIYQNDHGKHQNQREYERAVDRALSMLEK